MAESVRRQLSVQLPKKWKDALDNIKGHEKTVLLSNVRYEFVSKLDGLLDSWGYGRRFSEQLYDTDTPDRKVVLDNEIVGERRTVPHSDNTTAIINNMAFKDKPLPLEEECDKYRESIQVRKIRRLKRHANNEGEHNR